MPLASSSPVNRPVPSSSHVLAVIMFLDPRRWIGLLLAVFGVLVSVVVPFLPTFLARLLSYSETTVVPSRNAPIFQRPYASHSRQPLSPRPHNPDFAPTASRQRENGALENIPPSPHVKFFFEPHPRSTSNVSTTNPAVSSFEPDSLTDTDEIFRSPERRLVSLPETLLQNSFNNPDAMCSLDSLDLATTLGAQPIPTPNSQSSKRGFRMPRFGKRRSTSEQYHVEGDATSPKASAADSKTHSFEWQGNESFAVKRSTTFSTTPADVPSRRKFTLFSREASSNRDARQPITPPPHDHLTPPLPTPLSALRTPPITPPMNATAGPSKPRSLSTSPSMSFAVLSDSPLEHVIELPSRPQRTDPYKQFGVPVPGSDRARAFMKAEKERMRAEKERKERERDAEIAKKNKKSDRTLTPKTSILELPDPGAEADMEEGQSSMPRQKSLSITIPRADEFGALPLLSVVPEESRTSSITSSALGSSSSISLSKRPGTAVSGKRGWVFSRRSSNAGAEEKEEREEKEKEKEKERRRVKKAKEKETAKDKCKDRDKDKDKDQAKKKGENEQTKKTKSRLRSKSREGIRIPFMSNGSKKDRGYSSDTGVPSLTYQLIS